MRGSQQCMLKGGQQEMGKGKLLQGNDLYSCSRIYQSLEDYFSKEDRI
jgi:hypothetical protein